jgi:predicted phage baseplate assembly protein
MPLPRPILDNRSWEQLRDELLRRIPVYAPEWTDHNPSDPGVTLLELFAFLGEHLIFRFNQIPETARLEFLRLLQIPLRPARPARALLALTTEELQGVLVPQGTEAAAGKLPFETRTEVRVLPLSALAVCKAARPAPDAEAEPEVYAFLQRAVDALEGAVAIADAATYENEVVDPEGGGPTVDFDQAVDGALWVAVLAGKGLDPAAVRQALAAHPEAPLTLNLGFVPDPLPPAAGQTPPCPGEAPVAPPPAVEWQASTGRLDGVGAPVYRPLRVVGDTTRGLTQEGVVRLRLPTGSEALGLPPVADPDRAGTGTLPPRLDDEAEGRLAFWVRVFRPDGSRVGRVRYLGANAAEAEQSRRSRTEFLGTGTGQPDQLAQLVHTPVLPGTLVVEVEGPDGWEAWAEVDGFHGSGESDRHFVLDPEAGQVRFGNGLQGFVPQIGQRIRAREYRYGGGAAGNVAPKAVSRLPGVTGAKVSNPLAAHGGADPEPLEDALHRIPGELRRRDRAVTRGDFRELALQTPGADVGRAECLPRFHPVRRDAGAPGVVTVVVWPRADARSPGAPAPDRNLLRAVCAWLDPRRLVTTELYVVPPRYRKVAVAVGLAVKPGHGVEAVRRWVELALRQYLAPLPPFGPAGEGWPLGRRVHGPELEAAALQVEGVEFLEGLEVAGWDPAASAWVPGTVTLDLDEVPELAEITVVEGAPLDPGEALAPADSGRPAVPIPVVREEC